MRVLVACERSGIVRDAFRRLGHDAWSCDLAESEDSRYHIRGDVLGQLADGWELMVAHPPCTYLSYAGARWFKTPGRQEKQEAALLFFDELLNAPIPKIAIENPRGVVARRIRKPDDVIEPYQFGDPVKKRTYLWLKNLPPLIATFVCTEFEVDWVNHIHGSVARSQTFPGVAAAMAAQWGGDVR